MHYLIWSLICGRASNQAHAHHGFFLLVRSEEKVTRRTHHPDHEPSGKKITRKTQVKSVI